MFKSALIALLSAAALMPGLSHADESDQGMNTMWEVLWHQSGTATRLVRWNQDIKVRVFGAESIAYKQHTLQALRDVAGEAGVKVIDVSDRPDAAQLANVSIEIVPNSQLSDNQPCETRLNFRSETTIDTVTTQMRASDANRCAYHESMHMMGVRGHPQGNTVLSYFTEHTEGLLPLDKAMLHAWYSPRTRPGMTPFEFLPILGDELVAQSGNKAQAQQARDRFIARTVDQMQAFAQGGGDVPTIVKLCGKATSDGIRFGRMEMSYFLGVAYQQGTSVIKDSGQASQWLQRAASMGSRSAQMRMAAAPSATVAGNR